MIYLQSYYRYRYIKLNTCAWFSLSIDKIRSNLNVDNSTNNRGGEIKYRY